MKPSIEIQYRKLPREILSEFEKSIDKSISLGIYEDRGDHFDPPADIVIYINENLTEIIINGTAGVLITEIWIGVKLLWKKLVKRDKPESSIELNFKIKPDKEVEFNLAGNVDAKGIDAITEKILEYLKDGEQQKKNFANPDFKSNADVKPRIRIRYNPKSDKWEPVNLTEIKESEDELMRRLMRGLDS